VTRRELAGLVLAALLVLAGRGVRHWLLLDPGGAWREPGWLEAHLPPLPQAPPPRAAGPRRPSAPLDPNTCHPDSLELLPGIGPALAKRIVAARQEGVHFARARDLQVIRGIGPRSVERLTPYLTFAAPDSGQPGDRHSATAGRR
jgi:hypothetical protein